MLCYFTPSYPINTMDYKYMIRQLSVVTSELDYSHINFIISVRYLKYLYVRIIRYKYIYKH